MSEAQIAFLGVVVGGVLSFFGSLVGTMLTLRLEARKRKRETIEHHISEINEFVDLASSIISAYVYPMGSTRSRMSEIPSRHLFTAKALKAEAHAKILLNSIENNLLVKWLNSLETLTKDVYADMTKSKFSNVNSEDVSTVDNETAPIDKMKLRDDWEQAVREILYIFDNTRLKLN